MLFTILLIILTLVVYKKVKMDCLKRLDISPYADKQVMHEKLMEDSVFRGTVSIIAVIYALIAIKVIYLFI